MKKIFLFSIIFLFGAFFLGIILKKLDFGRVKSVKFSATKIYNFTLANKNHNKMYIKGKQAVETGRKLKIFYLNGYIDKEGKKTYVYANQAFLHKINKDLSLRGNVSVVFGDITLNTSKLNIDLEKQVAYGNEFCKITTQNTITTGNDIFINLKNETVKLRKVKTVIER